MDTLVTNSYGTLRFLPRKEQKKVEAESPPRLALACFSKPPRISFGTVCLGSASERQIILHNPTDYAVRFAVVDIPSGKGVVIDCTPSICFEMEGGEERKLRVTWTPSEIGKMRTHLKFQMENGPRLSCIVFGNCIESKNARKKIGKQNFDMSNRSSCHDKENILLSRPNEATVNGSTPRRTTFAIKKSRVSSETEQWSNNATRFLNQEGNVDLPSGNLGLQPRHSSPENASMKTFLQNMENLSVVKAEQDLISFDVTVLASNNPTDNTTRIESGTYVKQTLMDDSTVYKPNKTYDITNPRSEIEHGTNNVHQTPSICSVIERGSMQDKLLRECSSVARSTAQHGDYNIPVKFSPLVERTVEDISLVMNKSFEASNSPQSYNQEPTQLDSKLPMSKENLSNSQPAKIFHTANVTLEQTNNLNCSSSTVSAFPVKTVLQRNVAITNKVSTRSKATPKLTSRSLTSQSTCPVSATKSVTKRKKVGNHDGRRSLVQNALPIKRLKLVKPPKTSLARHPLPYATRNTFYDENWMQKQEKAFANWLNFVLTPSEDVAVKGDEMSITSIDGGKKQPVAPSREDLSYRAYTARRKMARLRHAGCTLYQADQLSLIVQKIESEVERGRIVIRDDRRIEADIGIQRNIHDMLMMFNSLWLRIGLEVVYGEIIPMQSNEDLVGLSRFLMQRFLANPDIAREYAHATVPGLYKKGYQTAMHKFILKKLLLLVIFLDHAKRKRIIDHDPCLFKKDAKFKCCKDLLLNFSREYLKGEGDISKHLQFLGCTISHHQSALDEFDFGVKNLATDLRCGIRLVRVIELITQTWTLSQNLRMPAVSRLQKIHNVGVVFSVLQSYGLNLLHKNGQNLDPRDVVDGHREKTLALLWEIVLHFKVRPFLEPEKLRREIAFLQKVESLQTIGISSSVPRQGSPGSVDHFVQNNKFPEGVNLLLKWCFVVCHLHGVKVENLSTSFSDGRAFCYLVHHYHPKLLPKEKITDETTLTSFLSEDKGDLDEELIYDDWTDSYSPNSGKNRKLEELLSNEKQNFKVLQDAVSQLGGIPSLISAAHMSNTIPDEKVVIVFLAYLSIRLIDIQEETKAARAIQMCWRYYARRKQDKENQIKENAARKVQFAARHWLQGIKVFKQNDAAIRIQSLWRGYRVRKLLQQQHLAAAKIQTCYKSWKLAQLERNEFLVRRKNACVVQAAVRAHKAATIIQASFRAFILERQIAQKRDANVHLQSLTEQQNQAARRIQSFLRMAVCRSRFLALLKATVAMQKLIREKFMVQSFIRQHVAIFEIKRHEHQAATRIQNFFKMATARRIYLKKKQAATRIGAFWKMVSTRRMYLRKQQSAIKIQFFWKMVSTRQKYLREQQAATTIGAFWKMVSTRRMYLRKQEAATTIGAFWKMVSTRRMYLRKQQAAIKIQSFWRMASTRRMYLRKQQSAIKIQSFWKMASTRRMYVRKQEAAINIQSFWKMAVQRQQFLRCRRAAITLQRRYRAQKCYRRCYFIYHCTRGAIITIQAAYRGHVARKRIALLHRSAIIIQSGYRCYVARTRYLKMQRGVRDLQRVFRIYSKAKALARQRSMELSAAVKIQALFRMFLARKVYQRQKQAAIIIQQCFRATLRGQEEHFRYHYTRGAILTIQAAYRGHLVRRQLIRKRNAAILIQKSVRRFIATQRFFNTRQAILFVHRRVRAKFNIVREREANAIKIQSAFRAYMARKGYLVLRKAVINIQRQYRSRKLLQAEMELNVLKRRSCILIQTAFRRYRQRTSYLELKSAVIKMQRLWRGSSIAISQRNSYLNSRKAVVKLQSAARCCLQRRRYLQIKSASIQLQRHWRAVLKGKEVREDYLHLKKVVITIQALVRMRLQRQQFFAQKRAALLIEEADLMHKQREEARRSAAAAVTIQRLYRGHMHRIAYQRQRQAVILIQQCFRRQIEKRKEVILRKRAAITIQSHVRTMLCVSRYKRKRKAVITLQRIVRNCMLQRQQEKMTMSAVVIQSFWRMVSCRCRYKGLQKASLTIQRRWRAKQCAARQREAFLCMRTACIKIQSFVRGCHQRGSFARTLSAVVKVQSIFRMYLAGRELQRKKDAVVKIQAFTRVCLVRLAYLRKKRAASLIEACYCSYRERARFLLLRDSAVVIQRRYRAVRLARQQRSDFLALSTLVRLLQRSFREKRERRKQIRLVAVVTLQRNVRMWIAKRTLLALKRRVVAATLIQSVYRGYRLRLALLNHPAFIRRRAAVKIQSAWRGYVVRKRMTKRLSDIRRRIEEAGDRVQESMKLGNRIRTTLAYLLTCKHLTTVHDALTLFEFGTRMSAKCCEQIVEDDAVQVLYAIIRNCNRGLASIEIIQLTLKVLLNLSRCQSTRRCLYLGPTTAQFLLDLLIKFQGEGKGSIFRQTCELLSSISQDEVTAKEMVRIPNLLKRLQGVQRILTRKQHMASTRNRTKESFFQTTFSHTRGQQKRPSQRENEVSNLQSIQKVVRELETFAGVTLS